MGTMNNDELDACVEVSKNLLTTGDEAGATRSMARALEITEGRVSLA